MSANKLLATIAETKGLTGLGKTKIYDLIDDGTLESVKVGSRRLVKMSSIRRLAGAEAA